MKPIMCVPASSVDICVIPAGNWNPPAKANCVCMPAKLVAIKSTQAVIIVVERIPLIIFPFEKATGHADSHIAW